MKPKSISLNDLGFIFSSKINLSNHKNHLKINSFYKFVIDFFSNILQKK